MFLRGLWDVSLNGDLIEISQRHLMPAGFDLFSLGSSTHSDAVDFLLFLVTFSKIALRASSALWWIDDFLFPIAFFLMEDC